MSIFNNKIIKNFSVLTGTNLVIQVLSILSSIRMARQLQPVGYGLFNLVTLQATIFSIVAAYGLRIVIIRHIARNRQDVRKIFSASIQIRMITTLIALVLAIGYNQLKSQQSLSAVFLFAVLLLIVFQTFWDSVESIFFGFEKMAISGILNLIFTIVWIAEIYIIPDRFFSVTMLLYAYVFNQVAKSIIYYFLLHRKILIHGEPSSASGYSDHKELIRQSNFIFIVAVFTAIQNQIPILLLQFNSSVDQIGLFNLGNRILSPLQMMLSMMVTALFPMFARLAVDNKPLFAQRIKSLMNIIVLTGIWGCSCFALFSRDIVHLLYGDLYITSANVILIQCWFTIFVAIYNIIGMVILANDRQKLLAKLSIIYGVLAAPVFYLGSKHGATGLAWAFVIAAFVNMTYHWVIFRNLLQKRISILYSFGIFVVIGLLSYGTFLYKIDYSFTLRLVTGALLSAALFTYMYKVEYSKIKLK
ncbi:MAG: oligosaccharide flippase family protein [Ferruginibacter sp.]